MKYFTFPLVCIALISMAFVGSAQAQVAWVQQSMYTFKVTNNTGAEAKQFKLVLNGVNIGSLDSSSCANSNFSHYDTGQDNEGTYVIWNQGSLPAGQSCTFTVVINHHVSTQSCDMIWEDVNGNALGHIDDVWPDWNVSGSSVYSTIHNRASGERYIRREIGYASSETNISALNSMTTPPNAVDLDGTGVTTIASSSTSTYDFSPYYLSNRSNFLFYKVYSDSSATSELVTFKTAATTTIPAGGISTVKNVDIDDYYISSPTEKSNYEVSSFNAVADSYEDIRFDWIYINTDSDDNGVPSDVTVKLWKDVNGDGKVDIASDQLLSSALISAGSNGACLVLTQSLVIPKGTQTSFVITFSLSSSTQNGSVFYNSIGDACAYGLTSGIRVPKTDSGFDGAAIILVPAPTTIGAAKKLPLDPITGYTNMVWLPDMIITADFGDVVYIEDKDRISGIGVIIDGDDHPALCVGMKASVLGYLTMDGDAELCLYPIEGEIGDALTPLAPLMMTGKTAGGGAFGNQPAVLDNAFTGAYSTGLNNIGKLIKVCGQVTGTTSLDVGDGETVNVAWIDDGSGLQDGVSENTGLAVVMSSDWNGTPISGFVTVTGIITAQFSPQGSIIKVLFPRSMDDIK